MQIEKCVCGFISKRKFDPTTRCHVNEGQEFIELKQVFFTEDSDGYFPQQVILVACPKCNTVKIKNPSYEEE